MAKEKKHTPPTEQPGATDSQDELEQRPSGEAEDDAAETAAGADDVQQDAPGEEEAEKLNLEVEILEQSACERHITVTIPREDIDRYFERELAELMPTAQVPGFRPGRAPRKLVERRFRKEMAEQVKMAVLLDSIQQVNEQYDLKPISEPDFDVDVIELPDEGPLTFEFDVEVQPSFDLPEWRGIRVELPSLEVTDSQVDATLRRLLEQRGQLKPHEGPAEPGDYIVANLTFRVGDQVLSSAEGEVIRIRPVLSFRDGKINDFDKLMTGVRAGQTVKAEAELSQDASRPELRGAKVEAVFEIVDVKRLEVPEITPELLDDLGGWESEADLRDAIHDRIELQLAYRRRERTKEQITDALVKQADWELPPRLLARQARRELERTVMELRSSGFSEDQIQAFVNEIWQNSREVTARALRSHFILERIAEEEGIEATEADVEEEILRLAAQTGETPRRVRARVEKSGNWDVLINQALERKVLDLITEHAEVVEVPPGEQEVEVEALAWAVGGEAEEEPPVGDEESEQAEDDR